MAFKCNIPAVPTVQQDDATVKITRWDFPPGAVTGWHTHGWPYLVVQLESGTLRIHDGTTETDIPIEKGMTYSRVAGTEHDVMNASPHPIAFIEIELKRPEAAAALGYGV